MSGSREHVGFEELNDLVDGRLDRSLAERLGKHLESCPRCRAEHEQLRSLLSVASAAAPSIDPGTDLWPDIRTVIQSGKDITLPVPSRAPGHPGTVPARQAIWTQASFLAAAAVVLVALSSGITAIVLRTSDSNPSIVIENEPSKAGAPQVLPAVFLAAEADYDRTIKELRAAVDAQRANLSAETVRTIDRSLAVVDTAIAEARAALVADPNNRTLVDLLAASYQRKLDLLRRTSELSSKI